MKSLLNGVVIALSAITGLLLAWAILEPPPSPIRLAEQVTAQLDASGVAHPVTAVLLNFRGYDTMLEVAVLLLALLGILVQRESMNQQPVPVSHRLTQPDLQILQWVVQILVPLVLLVAGYLLYAGAYRPGGAFQAGAVLAGGCVLLNLAGFLPPWRVPGLILRAGWVFGLLVFVAVAAAMKVAVPQGNALQYPVASAGPLILLIETILTFSLGLILAGLFLLLSAEASDNETEK